jgi:amino acid adenylation domain-containing protein
MLGYRSVNVYVGILGTLIAGLGVVPLNPTFPAARLQAMIEGAGLSLLILDRKGEEALPAILADIERPLTVVVTAAADVSEMTRRWPRHRFLALGDGAPATGWTPPVVDPDDWAYLFFTSGSTGVPKGVGVLHRNAARFVEMTVARYRSLGLTQNDRFSQFYELSFDSSMFDLYVCWAFGGCLCCPSLSEWVNPTKYILEKELTVIDIVPSTGHLMNRKGGLRPNRFPRLKLCRFGGEALSADLCSAFAAAAPAAMIDNAYGPTEATVDACHYSWHPTRSPGECQHGMVPIGYPAPGVEVLVVDDQLSEVPQGAEGELLLSGPQLTPGYWRDEKKTGRAFIAVPGKEGRYYRTGDLVRRPDGQAPILYLGRLDHQIKVYGVRIELGEIEMALREAAKTDLAVALGWPLTSSGASAIAAFLVNPARDLDEIRGELAKRLPSVMVPRRLEVVESLPLNANGKVDRKALLERLKTTQADQAPGAMARD